MRRCGANVRSAARCSTGAISRRICTCARAAAIIFAWARTIASRRSSTASSPSSGADVLPRRSAGLVRQEELSREAQRRPRKSGLSESVVCGFGADRRSPTSRLGVMDFHFRGGTMGHVTGERITLLLEEARSAAVPCIIFAASGGARMEEGMLALMQMAKTTAAVARFMEDGNLFVVGADRSDDRRRLRVLCVSSRRDRGRVRRR